MTSQSLILRPTPSCERDENAPILANQVRIADVVTASYDNEQDEVYHSFAAYLEVAQASAAELLGWENGPGHAAIQTLMAEAVQAGDEVTVGYCRRALQGDPDAFDTLADQVLNANLAALD